MWFCDFGKKFQYSIRYAHGNMKSTLPILKQRGQKYFAISDYGEISSWPSVYFKCKENDIVPILGIQTFLNNYRLSGCGNEIQIEKISNEECWKKNLKEVSDDEKSFSTIDYPLDLFARTVQGYYNIIQIHNDAQINGMDKRPRTNDKFICEHGKGIVAILPNPYSDVCSFIYNGMEEQALKRLDFYKKIFDEIYIAINICEDDTYRQICDVTIPFCQKHGIKMIPVCNSHYNYQQDKDIFGVFRKISKAKSGVSYDVDVCDGMYYKTKEQLFQTWEKHLKSEIFDELTLCILFNNYEQLLKKFVVLDIDTTPKMPKFQDGDKILRRKAYQGLIKKGLDSQRIYRERLQYELDNIIKAGFADYFLFLEDLFRWYKEQRGRFPSTGRGSGAGSLVLYTLGVMNVDPLKYNLLFQRFLDASRLQAIIEKGQKVTADQFPDVDCFTLDTLVLTPSGPKEIGDLHIGDTVITRENEVKKITNEIVHKNCPIVRVCYGSWYVDTTYNHKFLIKRDEKIYYEYVMNLKENDLLVESEDVFIPIVAIIDKSNVLKFVKDIEIEEEHCFRVCGKAFNKVELEKNTEQKIHVSGIVVHNCDFPGEQKDSVREYFIKKYGKNNVCHIGTVGYLKLRGVLKELGRLYDVPLEQVNDLTTIGLKQLQKQDQGLPVEQLKKKYIALSKFLLKYPQVEKIFDKIYGTINCWGIHAGGMLVADFDLTKQLPVRVTDGKLVSCWTEGIGGRQLGQMGFIKMDILAIDALSTIQKTIKLVNERHGTDYDLYNITVDDFQALDQLNRHDNIGIFQFDTSLASRVIDNMGGIKRFEDLPALNTLMRPAALMNGFDKQFGELRNMQKEVQIPMCLEKQMRETNGMPIYQQAAYFYAHNMAQFDKVNSYLFMKTLYKGKMVGQKIPYWKQKFIKGCQSKVKRQVIQVLFEDDTKKDFEHGQMVQCIDGIYRTIEEVIENGFEIK